MSGKMRGQFACSRMMLPEQSRGLRRQAEALRIPPRPWLDEQRHEEMQYVLDRAIMERCVVLLTIWDEKGGEILRGRICRVDQAGGLLFLACDDGAPPRAVQAAAIVELRAEDELALG